MYKVVLYSLFLLVAVSIIFGFVGLLPYGGLQLLYSFFVIVVVCYVSNMLFARYFGVVRNAESESITGLILFFILSPLSIFSDIWFFVIAGILAMASKYVLTINKKHLFNPVAVSLVLLGAFNIPGLVWWIGSSALLPVVAILGLLILRKTRRFSLFLTFFLTALVTTVIIGMQYGLSIVEILRSTLLSGPIVFFGMMMLTEPMTTPPGRNLQMVYGSIVGILFGLQFHVGPLYSSPELALVLGNIFSYIVSPKVRAILTLKDKTEIAKDTDEFVFTSDTRIAYKPGQYMEWTLGHDKVDTRGNRRYFTLASSPTENDIRLGIKFYEQSSSFKLALGQIPTGGTIIASQLAGDFTLPVDQSKKLVFIAGGIGVTPFRSMVKYLIDKKEKRDVVVLYSNRTVQDIAFKNIFDTAESELGIKVFHVITDGLTSDLSSRFRTGFITGDLIRAEIPDFIERQFYISGPHGMVNAFENTLQKMGVKKSQIKIDFFPGFA